MTNIFSSCKIKKTNLLSYNQQRLWYIQKLIEDKAVYHIPFSIEIQGLLFKDALETSILSIIIRHDTLRTHIIESRGIPSQKIEESPPFFTLDTIDLSQVPQKKKKLKLDGVLNDFYQKPFNMEKETLFRAKLIQLESDHFYLALTFHHIISDAASISIFCEELSQFYNHAVNGEPINLTPLQTQFTQYAEHQRTVNNLEFDYWKNKLVNAPCTSTFPIQYVRPPLPSFKGKSILFSIPDDLLEKLKEFSCQNNITLFITMFTTFIILLNRYAQQDDLIVGIPVTNRLTPDLELLIGFFINTLPLRIDNIDHTKTFKDLLNIVQENYIQLLENKDVPLEQIINQMQLAPNNSINPLFQVMFSYQEALDYNVKLKGVKSSIISPNFPYSKFDLTMFCEIETRQFKIEFSTDLYNEDTIHTLGQHYLELLKSAMKNSHTEISKLQFLTENEKNTILYSWNKTKHLYPPQKYLHHYFEDQAKSYPLNIAAKIGNDEITYEQLNKRANNLAYILINKGIKKGDPVALAVERSIEMIVAILGIIKAGGSYVPLDLSYPDDRLKFMITDSKSKYLITSEEQYQRFAKNDLDIILTKELTNTKNENPKITIDPDDIIYIIYTSGSTGQPKGSPNTHSALVNRILWMQDECQANSADVFIQKTPITFDVSGWEVFLPLITGSRLVLMSPDEHKDIQSILNLVREEKITIIHFIPSMLDLFLEFCENEAATLNLRIICVSGEELLPNIARKFFSLFKKTFLLNLYGPTEAGIDVTFCFYKPEFCSFQHSIIGKAIANTQIYIFDRMLSPVPINTKGEIYIGGANLSPGYINRPDLNKEKFILNPFYKADDINIGASKFLFKSGDIGKFRTDGNIEFLGRADNQVKILGVRVELSEIEAILGQNSHIKKAVVRYKSTLKDSHSLKAFIVLNKQTPSPHLIREAIEAYLREKLPAHMIPHEYFFLKVIPLLPNGKIDNQTLNSLEKEENYNTINSRQAETTLQKKVAEIWCGFLKIQQVLLTDTFFGLGGHSLLAIQVVALINEEFSTQLTLKEFLEHHTLEQLCNHLEALPKATAIQFNPSREKKYLSPFNKTSEKSLDTKYS